MKLPSLLKTKSLNSFSSSSSSWPWPSCHQPRTLSFRAHTNEDAFKTINAAFFDETIVEATVSSFSTQQRQDEEEEKIEEDYCNAPSESVIRRLRSDRLFFEPEQTSSILEAKAETSSATSPFKDSVVLSLESKDPYVDFRKSMEEMVAALGVKDLDRLQELLGWYLKVNGKANHGYIFGAFVDLLVSLSLSSSSSSGSSSNSSSSSHSPSSPLSFYSSSMSSSCSTRCVSSLEGEEEVEVENIPPSSSSSSFLLEQVREEIKHEVPSSSSNT